MAGYSTAIISCKTSLRERLTETAFWKREFERSKSEDNIKLIFITTDKDEELKLDTNRYILLHVIDYVVVTNPEKYERLLKFYEKKFRDKENFEELIRKIYSVGDLEELFKHFV